MKKKKLRRAYRNGRLIRGIGTWKELEQRSLGNKDYKIK